VKETQVKKTRGWEVRRERGVASLEAKSDKGQHQFIGRWIDIMTPKRKSFESAKTSRLGEKETTIVLPMEGGGQRVLPLKTNEELGEHSRRTRQGGSNKKDNWRRSKNSEYHDVWQKECRSIKTASGLSEANG